MQRKTYDFVLKSQPLARLDGRTVDVSKLNAFVFDQINYGYYAIGEKLGAAWHSGAKFIKK